MPGSRTAQHYRRSVLPYYRRIGSRWGYAMLLGRTRHFGWYEPGQSPWDFAASMRRMEAMTARKLALPAGSRVLDAGCGVGDVARTVATEGGLHVTGLDGIASDVAIARRRTARASGHAARATRFVVGDYHALPFADGSFDGLYTMESFVHAADPRQALSEFFRVVRPGGRLVMFEYSRTPRAELAPRADSVLSDICELAAMPAMLPHGHLERLVSEAGFEVESVTDITARVLPMLRAFSLLGRVPYAVARSVGRGDLLVNAMSGVELYRHQETWRYNICTAARP
ncbi:class I SAM-dependent methyltransferase [Streptomyces sp. NRRL S-118]|uniref:class I SAM-dependent methyltransferase n=1 Tax=Streptomyces sp. NRRL S-118 TaxID=1463881 RepID=UPI0004C55A6D|nr:methyltransferase domain-containing protein [Streptomyces sp. NRRL S-118]